MTDTISVLGHEPDSLLGKLLPYLVVLGLAVLGAAVYRLWGRYSIAVDDNLGIVFKGIAGMGNKLDFRMSMINGVCLTKVSAPESRAEEVLKSVIRLEGVDYYMEFGADLTDAQRAFIALFLLQKRLDMKAPHLIPR